MKKEVIYPPYTFGGIKPNHRAYPLDKNLRVMGGDTETCRGKPMTVQVHDGEGELFAYVDGKTIFPIWRDWVFERARSHGVNVCYFHYLKFDLPVLLYEKHLELYEQGSSFEVELHGSKVRGLFGKVNKFEVEWHDKVIHVLDSWAFTQASLDASLKMYKIEHRKREKPVCRYCQREGCPECHGSGSRFGWIRFDVLPEDDAERRAFEDYARQDGRALQALGRAIMGFHARYGVRPAISLPQFASRVLRHHFMRKGEVIKQPPPACVLGAQASYHGGLNWAPPDCPKVVDDATEVDVNSAYVHAMAVLPQFVSGSYERVSEHDPEHVGVYKVSGWHRVKYPILFTDDFRPIWGEVDGEWVTGFELERARRMGCELEVEDGWVWVHDRAYRHNPLGDFARHFWRLKEETDRESADYYFFKTCGNGVYGKLASTVEIRKLVEFVLADGQARKAPDDYEWDPVLKKAVKTKIEYRAGLMTHFFIASQITGLVRGMVHDMLVDMDGFHAATDAVKTTAEVQSRPGLGGWKIETRGRCWVFRNKLYLHFADSTEYCGKKHAEDRVEDGKRVNAWRYELDNSQPGAHLCKYALHGFKGSARQLYAARHALLERGQHEYTYGHMVGLREGLRRGEAPCSWVERREVLKLPNYWAS